MAIAFTKDQQRVIDARDKNILVSAAAGSGKTAVLVERIIQRVTDEEHPIDIDRMLVVTFTNAAAAGMKERISNAIQARLAQEPENQHLQRQAVLIHQAQITTIHSFCLYLIKNHFEAISLAPDFTVADEATVKLLAAEVKEQVLEEAFARGDRDFVHMVEFICHNGRERALEEYMDQMYDRAMSMPFPRRWLLERKKDYDFKDLDEFTHTDGGKYLIWHIQSHLNSYVEAYERLRDIALEPDGPHMYVDMLEQERDYLKRVLAKDSLEEIGTLLPNMEFKRLSAKKDDSVNAIKREWVKQARSAYKDGIQKLCKNFFIKSPQTVEIESEACKHVAEALVDVVIAYMDRLAEEKRKRRIIDFHDMEHMALEILLKETEDGYEPTEIAGSYQEFFEEVMVDEYQDSNMVQEYLVTAVSSSSKNNRFMVGDVKQSIYKFRLARPEIFMEKYHTYDLADDDTSVNNGISGNNTNIRIDLKQNFRSRREVLDATNSIFEKVMLPELGGIAYDEHAALYVGASYPDAPDMNAELIITTDDKPWNYNNKQWEAYCVANRIKELVAESSVTDSSGRGMRPITFSDIVLLFRTPSNGEADYKKVFEEEGIPLYMTSGSGYFDTVEIQNIIKFLQAIENPRLDIPLFGVCISIFGGMSEEQLARVKIQYNEFIGSGAVLKKKAEISLYDMLCAYKVAYPEDETGLAIGRLQDNLQKYREMAEYMTVSELLYQILKDYRYREYVSALPDGAKRLSNVSLLLEKAATFGNGSYQGLFAFTSYINQLQKQSIDYGEAGLTEHGDAVRVMSIHKSKGLEFPVVFVCGMGQRFSKKDMQPLLLIDNDMGLGMDYVNSLLRTRNKTLRRNVIALKMEQEILAEEQRILYVAMTRAKEKLIMAGYKGKYHGEEEDAPAYHKPLFSDIVDAGSYLDLCLLAMDPYSPITIREMTEDDYVVSEVLATVQRDELRTGLETELKNGSRLSQELLAAYAERFEYQYPYTGMSELYSKTSVSELKIAALAEEQEAVYEAFEKANDLDIIPYIPDFMREQSSVSGAERGTAYHRVMELLEFKKLPRTYAEWQQCLEQMVACGRLSERQRECIYIKNMQVFAQSDLAKRMAEAEMKGLLHKEQSFFLGIPANRADAGFPAEEMILVQGIIDVYFEEEGELVLVDYKTDRVNDGVELVDRYRTQMSYYAEALEKALGMKVKETVLYSLYLGEEVKYIDR